jgi:hypothetical protein
MSLGLGQPAEPANPDGAGSPMARARDHGVTRMPGLVTGVTTAYKPLSVPVCAPADGQPKPPPELTADGTVVLLRRPTVLVVDVPFVTPMPPVPDVPLPIVCSPENVIVQLSAGMTAVIVQPLVIVTVADACGDVALLYITFRCSGLAPVAAQAEPTVTVAVKPNASQPLYDRLIFADSVVAVPEGVVPEMTESPHLMLPPPDTAKALFVAVSRNAVLAGSIVVAEADADPPHATTSAIATARPDFLRCFMRTPIE